MKKKITNKDKNLLNIIIILTIFIGLFMYMLFVDGIDNMINVLRNVEPIWMLAGLLCMIIYWLIEAICLYIISKKFYKNQRFRDSVRVTMIGQLFNSITPFSSGGQPMQAVSMLNEGKTASKSATILLIKFIVFQATLVIYTLTVIIFQYSYFKGLVSNFINLAMIGFSVNFVIIVFLILIGINKKLVITLIKPIIEVLGRMKIIKNSEEKLKNLNESINVFHNQFKIVRKEKWMITKVFILSIIEHTVFFAVTYMVYKAFGQSGASIIKIMSAQAFLMMIMSFVPVPGAGIAAEGGFYIIFNAFFEKKSINMAILFWRNYTFYLPILIGVLFIIFKSRKYKLYKKKEDV
ncbi:MAG: lysylphosphatidylglycerol synthase transmembrane domain-containing protein [Clostridia bacterium]